LKKKRKEKELTLTMFNKKKKHYMEVEKITLKKAVKSL